MKLIPSLLLLTSSIFAQENELTRHVEHQYLYKASIVTLVAGNVIDAQSSYGRYELNPLLRTSDGRFGAKSIVIKGGITAGILLAEHYGINKLRGGRRISTIVNFALGVNMIGVGIQNHRGGF